MNLIRHSDLRIRIHVNLTVLKPAVRKVAGLTSHDAQDALVDAIMKALHGCVILRPDPVGCGHGQFGVTEPHPFPELAEPK